MTYVNNQILGLNDELTKFIYCMSFIWPLISGGIQYKKITL